MRIELRHSLDLGVAHRVVGCVVREACSEITHAVLEVAAEDHIAPDGLLAAAVSLELTVAAEMRTWELVVTAIRFMSSDGAGLRYELELDARLFLLRHTLNTRKFRDEPAHEIVARLLREHDIPFAFHAPATPLRPYTVQYEESSFDFVARLLEMEGYHYVLGADGTLVIADGSVDAPPVDGPSSHFDLQDAAGALNRTVRGVLAIDRTASVAPGRVTLRDFDWKTPRADLTASAVASIDDDLEIYHYPAGYRDLGLGTALALRRLEAERALARRVEGIADVPSFAPGRLFSLGDAAGAAFEGEWFLVSVEHRIGLEGERDTTYHNRFTAIPRAVPFRPRGAVRPTVPGVHTAMVRGPAGAEIHTDRFGRAKVQFHWDREAEGTDSDSRWVRVLQESSTSMALARVGWEIGVAYIDGDPERPVGISRQINGVMPPMYAQPANKNQMAIRTPSSPATGGYSELRLDDSRERMLFALRAEKDMSAQIGHDNAETVGNDERRFVGRDDAEAIGRHQSIAVGRHATKTVDGDRRVQIAGGREKRVAGDETVEVGGAISRSTEGNETERVGLARISIAAGLTLPDILGRAKRAVSSLIPEPGALVDAVVGGVRSAAEAGAKQGAMTGAKEGAERGLESGGGLSRPWPAAQAAASEAIEGGVTRALDGAVRGALGGLERSLTSLVPDPRRIASQITGGLSEGMTVGKIADSIVTGSIARTVEKRMSRTIGAAFVSVAGEDIRASSGRAHLETVGGVKLSRIGGNFTESVDGVLTITAGGALSRASGGDMTVAADSTSADVGAMLALEAGTSLRLTAETLQIQVAAGLSISGGGAALSADAGSLHLQGEFDNKAESTSVHAAKPLNVRSL